MAAIGRWEGARGLNLLGRLGFENAYAFAMRADRAKALGIASLDDLAAKADDLVFASDPEFLERPEWKAVRAAYPIRFRAANAYSPTFMYRALASGRADVISAYTSDGRIAADRLVVLTDPKRAIPGYDAILTLSPHSPGRLFHTRVNPGRSIPPAATTIHGIGDADVAGAPRFREIAAALARRLNDCDLAGFGVTVPLSTLRPSARHFFNPPSSTWTSL